MTQPAPITNDLLWNVIDDARNHLGAAVLQTLPSDDQIIMDHVKAAYNLLLTLRGSVRRGVSE